MILEKILKEFKGRMKIMHDSEDDNLKRLLSSSLLAIKRDCGDFDISENEAGKELVFERARYAYNDSLEFFTDNFLTDIIAFSISLYEEGCDGS